MTNLGVGTGVSNVWGGYYLAHDRSPASRFTFPVLIQAGGAKLGRGLGVVAVYLICLGLLWGSRRLSLG